jgi:hypothetical protein
MAGAIVNSRQQVRTVTVSADVAADLAPKVGVEGERVRLDGMITVINTGNSAIKVAGLQMDPARLQNVEKVSEGLVEPGETSYIPVIMSMDCKDDRSRSMGEASLTFSVPEERGPGSPMKFDGGRWVEMMMLACLRS